MVVVESEVLVASSRFSQPSCSSLRTGAWARGFAERYRHYISVTARTIVLLVDVEVILWRLN